MAIFLEPYKKYAQFTGRASRKEYWSFALLQGLVALVLVTMMIVGFLLGISHPTPQNAPLLKIWAVLGVVGGLAFMVFSLASFVPGIAVATRRLHDRGMSGWLQLIAFVPFGGLVLLVLLLLPGDVGDNQHGPNPQD